MVDTVLDGTYRTTATAAEFRRAGATDTDAINENAGRFTVTLRSGDWTMIQRYITGPKSGQLWKGSGNYTLEGKWFVWTWSTDPGDWSAAKVLKRRDGSLSFTQHADGDGPAELALTRVMFRRWAPARSAD